MTIFDQLDELDKIEEERLRKCKYFTDDGVEIIITHVDGVEIETIIWS
jgi:hypothetical protein